MSPSKPIQLGHYLGPSTIICPIPSVDWRLVVHKHGTLYLRKVTLLSTDSGSEVMRKLVREYEKSQSSWLKRAVPFLVPVIYTVTLSPVPLENISGNNIPCVVDIDAHHYSHVLTNALRNPETSLLLPTHAFVPSYSRFAIIDEAPGSTLPRDALLIKLGLSKAVLLVFLIFSFITSVGAGILADVLRQSLDSGFGVFGAVLGVIGIVEGYLTWLLK